MSCGIYMLTNKTNSKVYIGQSVNIRRRWTGHKRAASKGSMLPIHCAIRKYGLDAFSLEVVEECDSALLSERELFHIERLDAWARTKGYNIGSCNGGTPSRQEMAKMPEEARARWAEMFSARENRIALKRATDPAYDAKIHAQRSVATANRVEGYQGAAGVAFSLKFGSDTAFREQISHNRKKANTASRKARYENSAFDIAIAKVMRHEGALLKDIAAEVGRSVAWASLTVRGKVYATIP